jgi:hypothetical protein
LARTARIEGELIRPSALLLSNADCDGNQTRPVAGTPLMVLTQGLLALADFGSSRGSRICEALEGLTELETLSNQIKSDLTAVQTDLQVVQNVLDAIGDELIRDESITLSDTDCEGNDQTQNLSSTPLRVIAQALSTQSQISNSKTQFLCNVERIYQILGGDRWFPGDSLTPELTIAPEAAIESERSEIYPNEDSSDRDRELGSLLDLLTAFQAVQRQRSGQFKFPATVPENITDPDSEDELELYSEMAWQEWTLRQLDAISGAYPMEMKFKDLEGNEQDIVIANQSEALLEILGILLGLSGDTDILIQVAMKNLTETIRSHVTGIQACDWAKANAEFLGYKDKEQVQDFPLSISPDETAMAKILEEGVMKIKRYTNDDDDQLPDFLKRHSLALGIIKAAITRPFEELLHGERMQEEVQTQADLDDERWAEFLETMRQRRGFTRDPNAPEPEFRETTEDEL